MSDLIIDVAEKRISNDECPFYSDVELIGELLHLVEKKDEEIKKAGFDWAKSMGELKARVGELEKVVDAGKIYIDSYDSKNLPAYYEALKKLNQPDKG